MIDVSTGSRIAGYQIERLAGHGGMGVVYQATQLALGRRVALKLISPVLTDDPRFRERFKRESRLAASIDHPNVIPVYEAGEIDGFLFLSMRWVEGTDLATLIRRGGGLEPRRATRIVAQVAAALDAAHEHGLVHRDVKPANVLITGRDEHAYLTDFGLVKRIAGSGDLTRSGELVGTLDYVAPEQITGKGSDARSDIYSLGCLLFHSLTGRVPFATSNEIAKIYAHLNETPPPVSESVPELSGGLDGVVARALAKDPAERYASAGELGRAAVEAVEAMEREKQREAARSEAPTQVISDGGRPTRRRRALWSGAVAAVIAAAVAALLLVEGVSEGGHRRARAASAVPREATLVKARGGSRLYVVKARAKFAIPRAERSLFGYGREPVRVMSTRELRSIPNIPPDGSLLRAYGSTLFWLVRNRERTVTQAPLGADVAIIPSTGLRQIPEPQRGPKTSLTVSAPSVIKETKPFHLTATVRSRRGVPHGACVFLRIAPKGLIERKNMATQHGRCDAVLNVSGLRRVRYLIRFFGGPRWRDSHAATPVIPVARASSFR
jgi:hypothetical protein